MTVYVTNVTTHQSYIEPNSVIVIVGSILTVQKK